VRPLRAQAWLGSCALLCLLACGCERPAEPVPEEPRTPLKIEVVQDHGDDTPRKARLVGSSGSQLDLLAELGYVDGTVDPHAGRSGVLRHVRDGAQPGLNLYSSRKDSGAQLIDMDGERVHRWELPEAVSGGPWQHVHLLPGGGLLVLVKDVRLLRIDADSEVLWTYEARVHHDLDVDGEGRIHVLTRRAERREQLNGRFEILVDLVTTLSADGDLLGEQCVLDVMLDSGYRWLLPATSHLRPRSHEEREIALDLLHTNHVEVLDGSADGPLFAAGGLLVSMRNIDAVAILRDGEVAWLWGPSNLALQHHPVLLDDGQVLLFDNGTERSRVLEVDPRSNEIGWTYAPRTGFFSATRGSVQRLGNGNTLITESDTGYVIEVTDRGEIVWRFANPVVDADGTRHAVWRMVRIDGGELPFLESSAAGTPEH
jgi:hypothetical protein